MSAQTLILSIFRFVKQLASKSAYQNVAYSALYVQWPAIYMCVCIIMLVILVVALLSSLLAGLYATHPRQISFQAY